MLNYNNRDIIITIYDGTGEYIVANINTEQKVTLQHLMENVWLRKISSNKKDRMDMVTICLQLEDKTLVSLGFLHHYDGIYYLKNSSIGTIYDPDFISYIEKITGVKKSKSHTDINESAYIKPDVPVETVCEYYKNTSSIKKTAKNVGLSEEKTKKILITAGLYTSEKHKEIKELLEKGKTLEEIAVQLNISQKQIRAFLPYSENS